MRLLKIAYTSDLHGSTRCFERAVDAAIVHKVDALLIGGDITGKTMTPVIGDSGDLYEALVRDKVKRARAGQELDQMESDISDLGSYPIRLTKQQHALLESDEKRRKERFREAMQDRLKQWLWLAEKRLKPKEIRLLIICGNDDEWVLDKIIRESDFAEDPSQTIPVLLGDYHEVMGESAGNKTPFNCPRDIEDSVLKERISENVKKLKDPGRAIFMLHVPPYNSGLDNAYALDKDLKKVFKGGMPVLAPVGSQAVREIIEEHQPLIALHGHIHESPNVVKIGRTTCFNPGSEYWNGTMHGYIITCDRDRVRGHMPISG
jgi:uncharacterized protein